MGARWILKRVKMEAISAPTNWKIIILKFLIWLIAPLEIFIYIYILLFCFAEKQAYRIEK